MSKQIYVRPPFAGAVVRDPANLRPLPPEGAWVESSPHWRRQIKLGEVLEEEKPKSRKKKTEPAEAAANRSEV